jgi:RNA polymerase sigma factor (sigma-70 family)
MYLYVGDQEADKRFSARGLDIVLGINAQRRFPLFGYEKSEVLTEGVSGPKETAGKTSRSVSLTGQEHIRRQHQILELHDAHSASLFRYLRTLGLYRDEIEDIIQETFLRLAGHLEEGGGATEKDVNLRSWIFQVAYHLSMDKHRIARRDANYIEPISELAEEPIDLESDPEQVLIEMETMTQLDLAMTKLTQKQRHSILLRAEGLLYMEIGSVLGVSESRAINLVKRGIKRVVGGL